ncbi:MAG: DUF2190 family protein [Rickettsiales bacterium]
MGGRFAVATEAIASGVPGPVALEGVFTMPKDTSTAVSLGQAPYWDSDNDKLVAAPGAAGYAFAGVATAAALSADATVMGDDRKTNAEMHFNWSGSATVRYDPADTGQGGIDIGDTVTLNLYPLGDAVSAKYYSGSAIVTGKSKTVEMAGVVQQEISFTGTGALSQLTVPS